MPPKEKPRPTQESFDEAVRTNLDDFGMEPDEALKAAVEEFELQGFDLSGIIKSAESGKLDSHPVRVTTKQLEESLVDAAALTSSLQALQTLLEEGDKEKLQENLSVAEQSGTVGVLLKAAQAPSPATSVLALKVLSLLLQSSPTRSQLAEQDGVNLLVSKIKETTSSSKPDEAVQAAALATVAAACKAEEDNKDSFMRAGAGELALDVLRSEPSSADVVEGACSCLLAFTTADDRRPPTSKAFQHARLLAQKGASKVLVPLLKRFTSESSSLLVSVMATVRQLAANEEICKEVLQEGGVTTCLTVLSTRVEEPEVAEVSCSTLRQLANSDAVKTFIAENQGLEALLKVTSTHIRNADILERALGALAALMLRQPDIAAQAFQLGVGDAILEVMTENEKQASVQRQGCISFRNLVSRNPDSRQPLLEKGAEAVLRRAKTLHPGSCKDVGSAALRDLGLDNYNE